jgi:hypothetical protein
MQLTRSGLGLQLHAIPDMEYALSAMEETWQKVEKFLPVKQLVL